MSATHPVLRVARPTNDLEPLIHFYVDGLGFDILYRFSGHDGFDGVMLGHKGAPWHLEFTVALGHTALRAPSEDHLLILYLPDRGEWETAIGRMRDAGYAAVASFNPYWDRNGMTFEDPDGYRVVLQNAAWTM
jgi:catechol 2,3-dioxygenase-like lactoylglutathione lyase family enzyme